MDAVIPGLGWFAPDPHVSSTLTREWALPMGLGTVKSTSKPDA